MASNSTSTVNQIGGFSIISQTDEAIDEHDLHENTIKDPSNINYSFSPLHNNTRDIILEEEENTTYLLNQNTSNHSSINLWTLDNYVLPMSYIMVGTVQGLTSGIMTMFLLSIEATEAQQMTIKTLRSLPSILKIAFGFLSDSTPLFGYRRKIYMLIGWMISSLSMFALILSEKNIPAIALFYFLFGLGFWMADVIADSIMVEKSKLEIGDDKGKLSARCYSYRFLFNMITITIVTFAYDYISVQAVFSFLVILPIIIMLPAIYFMKEDRNIIIPSVTSQCYEIWSTISSQAVWQPMGFVYIFQLFQIGNGAWVQYLYSTLKFTSFEINSFSVVAYILLYCGVEIYRAYMMKWSWRNIFIFITGLSIILSINQVLLLLQINRKMGISDYIFALGDEAFGDFLSGIQFLPTILMMTHLCPSGSEGASFAMFTTVNNSALLLASSLSTLLLGIWDVSKSTLEKGELSGMINLTIFTSCLQIFPVLFVSFLPRGPDDMKELSFGLRSSIGGGVFLLVISFSVLWALITGVLNIIDPSWAGAS